MRSFATLITTVVMALGAVGLAVGAPGIPGLAGDDEAPEATLTAAAGAVRIANSRAGQAVLSAAGLRPGASAAGRVRISNSGDLAGRFAVRAAGLQDTPGPSGGVLSQWARLVLTDVSGARRVLYAGTPAGLSSLDLGTLPPGAEREYELALTLPNTGIGGGDNRYQGSAMRIDFEWQAGPAGTVPTPTPTPPVPTATPTPPPTKPTTPTTPPTKPTKPTTPGTTPPAPPADPTGEALGDVLGLPSANRCVSRRKFKIRLRAPNGHKVVSAQIRIKGKKTVNVKRGRTRAAVNLRGLRKGKVKVRLAVRASNGKTYRSTRTYRTCTAKSKAVKKTKKSRRTRRP